MKKLLLSAVLLSLCASAFSQGLRLREDNIDQIVSAMTPQEKATLLVGCGAGWGNVNAKFMGTAGWTAAIDRLGIPSIYFADGPQGVNMSQYREYDVTDYSCTFFLSGSSLATSWDVEAARSIGHAIGYELKERGLDVILGPGINLHRSVLGGRDQEYFSEDPVLAGKLAAAWIQGAQSNGVATSLKHFAVNNQETNRKENDSRVSVRALRELYLKAFEIAVKEGNPGTVMGAYNYVNGVHACENPDLLDRLLRQEWGWNGVVMSDWDGVVLTREAVKATCDLIEPGLEKNRQDIVSGLADGSLSQADVDRNVKHVLELVVKSPSFKGYKYSNNIDRETHQNLLRRVSAEGMVLLKNDGNALPLTPGKVALYGCASYDLVPANMGVGGSNHGVYHVSLVQGLRQDGFTVNWDLLREYADYVPSAKEKIRSAFPAMYAQFYRFDNPEEIIPGQGHPSTLSAGEIAMAADAGITVAVNHRNWTVAEQAAENDAAIITFARTTGEAFDRHPSEYDLTESERKLLEEVSAAYRAAGKPVVVLLNVPAGIETASWRDQVDAILLVGQPGERAGESIADALCGQVAPSGRLNQSWSVRYGDAPADRNFPVMEKKMDLRALFGGREPREGRELVSTVDYTNYEEGLNMGYRYFVSSGTPVAYPFGHGLTYTTFAYEDAAVTASADGFVARVTVRNTGSRPGREVVQLYVSAPAGGLDKPARELKGFAKTRELRPGESQVMEIPVTLYDLASFNEKKSAWQTAKGTYRFCFGASSEKMLTETAVKLAKASEWKTDRLLLPQ